MEVVGGPVEAITLPSLLKNIRPDAAVVIKLDIQGFECRVLRHMDMFNTSLNIPYIFMEWNMLGSARVAGLGRLSAGAKMAMKPFVKRVFTIFATNAWFLRV